MLPFLLAGLVAGCIVSLLSVILPASTRHSGRNRRQHIMRFLLIAVSSTLLHYFLVAGTAPAGSASGLTLIIWTAIFMLIAVIDIEERRVMPVVLLPAGLFALLEAAAAQSLASAVAGGSAGALLGIAMFLGGQQYQRAMSRRRGVQERDVPFGGGDVLLAGLCGLVVGWPNILLALLLAVFSAGAVALVLLATGRVTLGSALPYAPFLLAGTVFVMRFPEVSGHLLRLSG